jgi:hypothetical protein
MDFRDQVRPGDELRQGLGAVYDMQLNKRSMVHQILAQLEGQILDALARR